jgi:hypothetical protein
MPPTPMASRSQLHTGPDLGKRADRGRCDMPWQVGTCHTRRSRFPSPPLTTGVPRKIGSTCHPPATHGPFGLRPGRSVLGTLGRNPTSSLTSLPAPPPGLDRRTCRQSELVRRPCPSARRWPGAG